MRPEHWLFTIPLRLRSLFRWRQADQELDDELRDHLERKTEQYVAQGMTKREAHRRARLDLGGIEQTKEKCRDARRVNWIEELVQDLCFGLRMLRKSPGFTAVAVLTLALGIGANTAIFSMVNSLLSRSLPVKDPEQITVPAMQLKKGELQTSFSYPELEDLQAQSTSVFSNVIAMSINAGGVTLNGKTEPIVIEYISGNFFTSLGVRPLLGRFILPSEGSITAPSPSGMTITMACRKRVKMSRKQRMVSD